MAHALSLGARGLGRVRPNPAVGCVVVKDGRVVGRGRTADGGRPHAETIALEMAGEAARGATVYVSLEPCGHHGQTPPCVDALIASGVARVVVALEDPRRTCCRARSGRTARCGHRSRNRGHVEQGGKAPRRFSKPGPDGTPLADTETRPDAGWADCDRDRGKPLDHGARSPAGCPRNAGKS